MGVLPTVEVGADDGPVDGVEHEVEVRDAAWVASEQLEDAPDGEEVPGLERRAEPLDVDAAPDHDEAEGGGEAGAAEHGARDPARGAPWAEVLMDEAEVGRARAVGGWRGGRWRDGGGGAGGGRGERAREGMGGSGRFGGYGDSGEVEAGAGDGVGGRRWWRRGRRRWRGRARRLRLLCLGAECGGGGGNGPGGGGEARQASSGGRGGDPASRHERPDGDD